MNHRFTPVWVVCAIGVAAAGAQGCGSDAASATGVPTQNVAANAPEPPKLDTADEFIVAFSEAWSQHYVRCFGGAVESWREYRRITQVTAIEQSLAAGRLVYDADSASDCIAALAHDPCESAMLARDGRCALALHGQVPLNAACRLLDPDFQFEHFPNECTSGSSCRPSNEDDEWVGTCQDYQLQSETCSSSEECAAGFVCSGRRCVAGVEEGLPCDVGSGGAADSNCLSGLYCEGGSTYESGICRKAKTSGACSSTSECASGHACLEAREGGLACVRKKGPGEACSPGECWGGHCNEEGKCALSAQEGAPCGLTRTAAKVGATAGGMSYMGEFITCGRGLFCNVSTPSDTSAFCEKQIPPNGACADLYLFTIRPQCQGNDTMLGHCQVDRAASLDSAVRAGVCQLQ